jgi:AAA15 family ATPase/GTPase
MYLKSLKIENFRKFGNKNNIVEFVDSRKSLATTDDINVAKATSLIVGKNNAGKTTIITALDKIVNSQRYPLSSSVLSDSSLSLFNTGLTSNIVKTLGVDVI